MIRQRQRLSLILRCHTTGKCQVTLDCRKGRNEKCSNCYVLGKILFYCNSPSSCDGGQTPICDMRRVYRDLAENVLEPLIEKGVRYSR